MSSSSPLNSVCNHCQKCPVRNQFRPRVELTCNPDGSALHVDPHIEEGICEAGRVIEQHPHCHAFLLIHAVNAISIHLLRADLRCDLFDELRIIEWYASLLNELQDCNGGNDLSTGRDPLVSLVRLERKRP
jgi:hypothetical protein